VTDKKSRDNFVVKTVKMLETRGFDGLALEWNFPVCWQSNCLAGKRSEKEGFVALAKVYTHTQDDVYLFSYTMFQ
jgi:chitinase